MVTLRRHAGNPAVHATITRPGEFSDSEIALARSAAGRLPGAWSLECERDYDGNPSLILLPGGDDADGPTFLLDRVGSGVGLAACRWDKLARLGCFVTIEAALARVAEIAAGVPIPAKSRRPDIATGTVEHFPSRSARE